LIAEGLALTASQQPDFSGAASKFTQAIDVDDSPNTHAANAYYNRGLTFYSMGNSDDAIDDYTAGIDLDPDMHDLYLARGIAWRENDNLEQAGVDFAVRIDLLADETTEDTLMIGASKEVEMAYGRVYRFTFEGQAGQRVTLLASDIALVGVDPLIVLLDPDGTPLAGDDDLGGDLDAEIADFELSDDGLYTLVVSHANGGYDGLVSVFVRDADEE
jgi:tetratricopeptide (TPR) repeat protein